MATQAVAPEKEIDSTKPQAMAIPKEGYFKLQNGRYGPLYPRKHQPVMASRSLRRSSLDERMSSADMARQSRRQ